MKTRSIGEILKQERERHRLSLSDLAKRTRIREEYLFSLENNDFDKLPAAIFVKGYIRSYGQVFGFDHRPLQALLRRDYKESARGKLVPREFIKPVLKRRFVWTQATMTAIVLSVIFLAFVSYVLFSWINLQKPPELTVLQPQDDQLVSSQVIIEGKTLPDAMISVNSQPVALQIDGSFKTEILLPRDGINTITIEASDRRGKVRTIQRTVKVEY